MPSILFQRGLQAALATTLLCAGAADAALVDRGGGVVYDTGSGLDWERSPSTVAMNWHEANDHVAALALAGGGWRLPSLAELTNLYNEISALTACADCTGDQGLFEDIQLGAWSSQQYFAGQPGAYYVGFWTPGYVAGLFQTSPAWTWAVRAGEPLPEPATLLLAAAALAGLAATRRRRG